MFSRLFDVEGFPPRWRCGTGWTPELGWTHIISDIFIWASYLTIPLLLLIFIMRRRDTPFPRVFWLFIMFIFLCGTTHLIEAIIFWHPIYRLSALVKAATAIVSVLTVIALVRVIPQALLLKSPEALEREVQARTHSLEQSTKQQRLLMSELDHRVKNNIASIMSLAEQTIATNTDMDSFREAFLGRLRAMASVHESLSRARWTGASIESTAGSILRPYQQLGEGRIKLDGPDIRLDATASNALCLAIHELATNSTKYGSLSRPAGTVRLSWRPSDSDVSLEWTESNGPPVEPPASRGFGTILIQGMIEHNLDGRVEFDFRNSGLRCLIGIPAARIVTANGIGQNNAGDQRNPGQ
ncbi:MAG: sensor histidine kinase [Phycisphaerales bacterium]